MKKTLATGIFGSRQATRDQKSDTTTRAAQELIEAEKTAREKKTDRLRAARLMQEAKQEPVALKNARKPKTKSPDSLKSNQS